MSQVVRAGGGSWARVNRCRQLLIHSALVLLMSALYSYWGLKHRDSIPTAHTQAMLKSCLGARTIGHLPGSPLQEPVRLFPWVSHTAHRIISQSWLGLAANLFPLLLSVAWVKTTWAERLEVSAYDVLVLGHGRGSSPSSLTSRSELQSGASPTPPHVSVSGWLLSMPHAWPSFTSSLL